VNAPVVEEIAGGPGLVAGYNRRAGADLTRAEQVLAAAERGDVTAAEVVREGARLLGVTLGWLVNTLDPEALIVGGGLGSAAGMYWEALVAATRAHIWADAGRSLPITQTALGADAGIIGAAAGVAP
jgi:glucokinase